MASKRYCNCETIRRAGRRVLSFLKSFIFIACVGGFTYQVTQFFTMFYSYPTMVNIDIRHSKEYILPAITICNLNPVKRSEYCGRNPHNCEKPQDMHSFCSVRPHYCKRGNLSNFMIPKPYIYERTEVKILEEFGTNDAKKLIEIKWPPDQNVRALFLSTWQHFSETALVPCFIMNSRVNSDQKPENGTFLHSAFGIASRTLLKLNVEEDEMFDPKFKPRALVQVHSPFTTADPELRMMFLEPGKSYMVNFRLEVAIKMTPCQKMNYIPLMEHLSLNETLHLYFDDIIVYIFQEEHHLLPAPYKTDCRDYEETWQQENKTGPRSQLVCLTGCFHSFLRICMNCTQEVYAKLQDKCLGSMELNTCSEEELKRYIAQYDECITKCKDDCKNRKYPYRVGEMATSMNELVDSVGRGLIKLDIVIEEPEITVFQYLPQYIPVELFSNIGGFLGCWLGISTWSSADFFLSIPVTIYGKTNKWIKDMRTVQESI